MEGHWFVFLTFLMQLEWNFSHVINFKWKVVEDKNARLRFDPVNIISQCYLNIVLKLWQEYIIIKKTTEKWWPSWTPSWIAKFAPCICKIAHQFHIRQTLTNILVYNMFCSTFIATYSLNKPLLSQCIVPQSSVFSPVCSFPLFVW